MRETAGRETELLAGELTQRMQVVTAQLDRAGRAPGGACRVECGRDRSGSTGRRAVGVPVDASRRAPPPPRRPTTPWPDTLGQLAMLLNNVELRDSSRRTGRWWRRPRRTQVRGAEEMAVRAARQRRRPPVAQPARRRRRRRAPCGASAPVPPPGGAASARDADVMRPRTRPPPSGRDLRRASVRLHP